MRFKVKWLLTSLSFQVGKKLPLAVWSIVWSLPVIREFFLPIVTKCLFISQAINVGVSL